MLPQVEQVCRARLCNEMWVFFNLRSVSKERLRGGMGRRETASWITDDVKAQLSSHCSSFHCRRTRQLMLLASTYRNSSSRFYSRCSKSSISQSHPTHRYAKIKVRSVDSQTRVETQNTQTDRRTRPITVHSPLTRSLISLQEYWFIQVLFVYL